MLYTPRMPHSVSTPQGRTLLSYIPGAGSLPTKLRACMTYSKSAAASGQGGSSGDQTVGLHSPLLSGPLVARSGSKGTAGSTRFPEKGPTVLTYQSRFPLPLRLGRGLLSQCRTRASPEVEVVAAQASLTSEPLTKGVCKAEDNYGLTET